GGGCMTCSETSHGCTEPKAVGTSCSGTNVGCISGGLCDGSGQCVGSPRDCSTYNSSDGCTVGVCDPITGGCKSQSAPEGTPCDDKNACTVGDHCSFGTCTYGSYAASGSPCNDNNPCTTGDYCSSGYCSYTGYAVSGTACGSPCSIGTCYGTSS